MSRHKIEAVECDRCGEAIQFDEHGGNSTERHQWGRVFAATLHNEAKVGTSETAADLCGGCMDDLVRFMAGCSLVAPEGAKAKRKESVA